MGAPLSSPPGKALGGTSPLNAGTQHTDPGALPTVSAALVGCGCSMIQFPEAPQPVHTPTYSMGTNSLSFQEMNGVPSPSRPADMVPWSHLTQNPRNSPPFKMLGVGISATSGFERFLRITDLVLPQPPRKISYIGSVSDAPWVRAMCASLGARTRNWRNPELFGKKWYSSLSEVANSAKDI